jgi:hypothetical protein
VTNHPNRGPHGLAKSIVDAVTGERTLADKIDAIGHGLVMSRNLKVTDWERKFCDDLIGRHIKFGDALKLSPKQIEIVDRLHDRIKHDICF